MGRVHIGGGFQGEVDFDPGDSVELRNSIGAQQSFLLSLDRDGNFLTVNTLGGKGYSAGCGLAVTNRGNVIESGFFSGRLIQDTASPHYSVVSKNQADGYVLKYDCFQRTDTLTYQICNGDSVVSPSKSQTWYSSGIYKDTITALANYCPDIFVISIDVVEINDSVIRTKDGLESIEPNASYQWYDCSYNPPLLLQGETHQSLLAERTGTQYGDYRVELSKSGCSTLSACKQMSTLSVKTESLEKMRIYPNPTNAEVALEFSEFITGTIMVYDMKGRLISDSFISNNNRHRLNMPIESGIYLVCVKTGDNYIIRKVLKH